MSLYNILFGMNSQSDLLLAVIGLRKHEVERFRDVHVRGEEIVVYTRTGGGNRADYPNLTMRQLPAWLGSVDDDFDSTYCTDRFGIPHEFVQDVQGLSNILAYGLRAEFGQHLLKTLDRPPTDADQEAASYAAEQTDLRQVAHQMANGYTFVPLDDHAMDTACKLAEAHDGELRTAWGILPLTITIEVNHRPYPTARDEDTRDHLIRARLGYTWTIDQEYWAHCQQRFSAKYPLTMAKIAEKVRSYAEKQRR